MENGSGGLSEGAGSGGWGVEGLEVGGDGFGVGGGGVEEDPVGFAFGEEGGGVLRLA